MRDLIKDTPLIVISPAPGGIQTHDLSVTRRVLYRCATTTALFEAPFVPKSKQKKLLDGRGGGINPLSEIKIGFVGNFSGKKKLPPRNFKNLTLNFSFV